VANHHDALLLEAFSGRPATRWFNDPDGWHLDEGRLRHPEFPWELEELADAPGQHNLANLAAALTLAGAVGPLPENLAEVLSDFRGLPHRLHTIGDVGGLRYVDDSLSTTPVATLAALRALHGRAVTVLVGGLDRGLDWSVHAPAFNALAPHALVALPDNGPHILSTLAAHGLAPGGGLHEARDMADAVARARAISPPGGVVLLSPGAPSFPHYADYRARGEAFARAAGINETAGQG
jgi:UDP-N-acetylmuramoylalanine--D-glutamate ligase